MSRERALEMIEQEHDLCFDVAADHEQQFYNVFHMEWFVEAVEQELTIRDDVGHQLEDDDFVVSLDDTGYDVGIYR